MNKNTKLLEELKKAIDKNNKPLFDLDWLMKTFGLDETYKRQQRLDKLKRILEE